MIKKTSSAIILDFAFKTYCELRYASLKNFYTRTSNLHLRVLATVLNAKSQIISKKIFFMSSFLDLARIQSNIKIRYWM